ELERRPGRLLEMRAEVGRPVDGSPSLDRIEPEGLLRAVDVEEIDRSETAAADDIDDVRRGEPLPVLVDESTPKNRFLVRRQESARDVAPDRAVLFAAGPIAGESARQVWARSKKVERRDRIGDECDLVAEPNERPGQAVAA